MLKTTLEESMINPTYFLGEDNKAQKMGCDLPKAGYLLSGGAEIPHLRAPPPPPPTKSVLCL